MVLWAYKWAFHWINYFQWCSMALLLTIVRSLFLFFVSRVNNLSKIFHPKSLRVFEDMFRWIKLGVRGLAFFICYIRRIKKAKTGSAFKFLCCVRALVAHEFLYISQKISVVASYAKRIGCVGFLSFIDCAVQFRASWGAALFLNHGPFRCIRIPLARSDLIAPSVNGWSC